MDRFPSMKRFALQGILLVGLMFVLNGCASRDDALSEQTSLQSTAPVPGEKIPGEGVTPGAGPGAASANVRW